jgi:hypothetical protein
MIQPLLQAADLRGAAQLTTDAVAGLTSLVEAMHARIARLPRLGPVPPDERTSGITGLVYKTVRGVTRVVGGSVDALLAWLGPTLGPASAGGLPHVERGGRTLVLDRSAMRVGLPGATPRLLLLLHGLCMNDLQWLRQEHDHGAALARDLGYTPVYLHYNSGLSVSTNGRVLAQQLERLLDAWPVPVERLVLMGHSMGGLVARSALFHAVPASGSLKSRLLGDGLVPVASALGQHREPARRLAFDADRQAVVHGTGHLELLSSPEVYEHLKRWLS